MSSPEAKTMSAAGWLAGLQAVMGATAGTSSAALECPRCVPGLYRCPRDHVAEDAPWSVVTAVKVAGAEPRQLPRAALEPPAPVVFLWPRGLPRVLSAAESAPPVQPAGVPGTPHPSPFLAAQGWEMLISGVWGRRNEP